MRMLGKRTSKRKNKRSYFKHYRDKTKTEKRKALQNSKSDKEINLVHILIEASNDSDDEEAEDVEMEGEDADGKEINDQNLI